ncbi:hypothetical protein Anas_03175 [Armadillidium nasatum]|uniref:Uncharacterized protein n=1 Tax=Armadillidium nasatum TaxID=96803 RepID=A0A5N5SUT0_9CRUS|nr:hypothetical protein Anas_03175 [Armadillidium nasatum]
MQYFITLICSKVLYLIFERISSSTSSILGLCILFNMCTVSFSFITSVWSRCRDYLNDLVDQSSYYSDVIGIAASDWSVTFIIEYELLLILEYKGNINETDLMNLHPRI